MTNKGYKKMWGRKESEAEQGNEGEQKEVYDGWLDRLLEIGSTPDFITPLIAIVGTMTGNLVDMATPLSSWGWTYSTLRGAGVKVIAAQVYRSEGVMMFCVPAKQIGRARKALGGT